MKPNRSLVALLAVFCFVATTAEDRSPEEIDGLVARYEARTLHRRLADNAKLETWEDSSGNGHDLSHTGQGLHARFHTHRVNDRPAVTFQRHGRYSVRDPFELGDHTIFVVARTGSGDRALVHDDAKPSHGIVLWEQRRQHVFRTGGVGTRAVAYTYRVEPAEEFGLTVLAREAGRLRAYADGLEVSSGDRQDAPLRIGGFFRVVYSQHVDKDGQGLEIAEMLFYDRFLSRNERETVTTWLVSRYGLAGRMSEEDSLASRIDGIRDVDGAELVWLGTDASTDLNAFEEVAAVSWTTRERVDPPFANKPGHLSTRLACERDGTLVRLYVSLELVAETPGSNVRVLLLKNGADYLEDDVLSGPFGGEGDAGRATVELETTIFLDAGEWVEVVSEGYGERGRVQIVPGKALLVAEVR